MSAVTQTDPNFSFAGLDTPNELPQALAVQATDPSASDDVDTSDGRVREAFDARVREEREERQRLLRRLAIDEVQVRTDRGYVEPLLQFFRALFGQDREVRMRTSHFPFTEPSVEFDVTCFICSGRGCATCKHSGWIEMGGAGWVNPDVFRNVDLDPDEWQGFAFGFGIERIALLRHGIPDLRMFWEDDLRVLGQF